MSEPPPLEDSLAKLNASSPGLGDLGRKILDDLMPPMKPPTQQEGVRRAYRRWARAHRN